MRPWPLGHGLGQYLRCRVRDGTAHTGYRRAPGFKAGGYPDFRGRHQLAWTVPEIRQHDSRLRFGSLAEQSKLRVSFMGGVKVCHFSFNLLRHHFHFPG